MPPADTDENYLCRLRPNDPVLGRLPAHSDSVFNLTEALSKVVIDLGATSQVVRRDPAITAQVLRMANHSSETAGAEIYRIEECIVLIGAQGLKEIIFTIPIFSPQRSAVDSELEGLWRHSRMVAVVSEFLARASVDMEPERAYLAGLLHEVSRLADLGTVECGQEIDKKLSVKQQSRAGSLLAYVCGLPLFLSDVIEHHRQPELARYDRPLVSVVSAADRLCHELECEGASLFRTNVDASDLLSRMLPSIEPSEMESLIAGVQEVILRQQRDFEPLPSSCNRKR